MQSVMPFSIIGSTEDVTTPDGRVVKGREYLWGVAEGQFRPFPRRREADAATVENEDHCDFKKLRSLLIRTYMLDLTTSTEETHYEAYRLAQMETRKFGEPKVKKSDNPRYKEEEEQLRKRFTEQVKLEESRFRQWEQHVSSYASYMMELTQSSLSPSETGSTRISSTLTRLSRLSRSAKKSLCQWELTSYRASSINLPRTTGREAVPLDADRPPQCRVPPDTPRSGPFLFTKFATLSILPYDQNVIRPLSHRYPCLVDAYT